MRKNYKYQASAKPSNTWVMVRISPENYTALATRAIAERRSLTNALNVLLREVLQAQENK
jgi:hypothetical protein